MNNVCACNMGSGYKNTKKGFLMSLQKKKILQRECRCLGYLDLVTLEEKERKLRPFS